MDLFEISIKTSHEAVDAISNFLMENGADGVEIKDANDIEELKKGWNWKQYDEPETKPDLQEAIVSAFFPANVEKSLLVSKIKTELEQLPVWGLNPGAAQINSRNVQEEDWSTEWERYYHPQRVTRFLTVVPKWEDYQPSDDELVIRLDPGMAFGTGTHPTTILSLEELEIVIRGGETVYDVGCGSAVLGIAASKLGARRIKGFDVSETAVKSAKRNVLLNSSVKNVSIAKNSLLTGINTPADIVVANMLPEVLLPLIPQAAKCVNNNGHFLLSGIIDNQLDKVIANLKQHHFKIEQVLSLKDWRGVIAKETGE